jgi:O-antigen/teichoic acid export membrane protein
MRHSRIFSLSRHAGNTLRQWLGDQPLRARLFNIGHLLSGNLASGLISLVAISLTARAVGPASYGILALAISYVRAVERLVTFQSWQPLIKYGAEVMEPHHAMDFKSLLKYGLMLDVVGAVAAWAIATGLALLASPVFGWDERMMSLVAIYCTVLLFNINGTPTAILRLYGRYHAAAYGPIGNAALRVVLCLIGIYMGAGLEYFVFVWMATQILGALTFLGFSIRALRINEIRGVLSAPLKGVTRRFPGLWSFAWQSNISLTLRSSAQQLDTLLVGALADPASAGFYHIAKQVGRMAQQIGTHVQAVLYPDIARLWAAHAVDEFRKAITQVEVMLIGFGCAVFLFLLVASEPLIRLTAGPEFIGAAPLMIVQGAAVALMLLSFPARSALLAMGHQRHVLNVALVSTIVFHLAALALIPLVGAMGANIAHILLATIWLIALSTQIRRELAHGVTRGSATSTPSV